jgi:hypothetical protein
MKKMLLTRLYKEWRLMFWLVLLLAGAQVFFMAKGIENLPFFLYHMYSRNETPADSVGIYLIRGPMDLYLNHKQLSNREEELLMNSVAYYVNLKKGKDINATVEKRFARKLPAPLYDYLLQHLTNDAAALTAFPQWWADYFNAVSNNNAFYVSVVKTYVYASPPFKKSVTDSVVFTLNLK